MAKRFFIFFVASLITVLYGRCKAGELTSSCKAAVQEYHFTTTVCDSEEIKNPEGTEPQEQSEDNGDGTESATAILEKIRNTHMGFATRVSSYEIGVNLSFPVAVADRSDILIQTGVYSFFGGTPYIIEGDRYEASVLKIPVLLSIRTIHLLWNVENDRLALYSIAGGGPFLGVRSPSQYETDNIGPFLMYGFGGELYGALGAELFHSNGIAYSFEVGLSYATIPTRNFVQQSSFLSPSISVGIRFF